MPPINASVQKYPGECCALGQLWEKVLRFVRNPLKSSNFSSSSTWLGQELALTGLRGGGGGNGGSLHPKTFLELSFLYVSI